MLELIGLSIAVIRIVSVLSIISAISVDRVFSIFRVNYYYRCKGLN